MAYTLTVLVDDGSEFAQAVEALDKARALAVRIARDGYCVDCGDTFEHYPPHRIAKIATMPEIAPGQQVRFWRALDTTPHLGRVVSVGRGVVHVAQDGIAAPWAVPLSSVQAVK